MMCIMFMGIECVYNVYNVYSVYNAKLCTGASRGRKLGHPICCDILLAVTSKDPQDGSIDF